MTENGQLDFLDILSVLSFYIAVLTLDLNVTQNDMIEQTEDIHRHLEEQDIKLSEIINTLEELKHDSGRSI